MNISVIVPTYEMAGNGVAALNYLFQSLQIQSYKDFDVVVSDDSENDDIKNFCSDWIHKLSIEYYKNKYLKGASNNLNHAIEKAKGKFIKILLQDDLLFDENSLQIIANNLDDSVNWLFTDYIHSNDRINFFKQHHPSMNSMIAVVNSLGTPSALTIKNEIELPKFDNNLTYCYDEDFYFQMYQMYGNPKVVDKVTMINFLWEHSVTSKITAQLINKENNYILEKHNLKTKNPFNGVTVL